MARNKHPEETVNLILSASFRLFMKQGYEHTSIQDIIDQLGGLSKGAIYHHFKSKEDILMAVMDRMTGKSNQMLAETRDRSDLTGREKLKTIFKESINRSVQNDIFTVAPNFHNNPKLLFSLLHDTVDDTAPNYIEPIIRQGISDGSIETDYPEQLAELVLLVANVWMNPMVFDSSEEESYRKFMIFAQMMQGFGLDILDDEMLERLKELAAIYQKRKQWEQAVTK
ncbi:MAG: TetR/AcrR family transcriptional regulator [Lachnospiraceae bacterium]|nr:TetR/AcrR family transcriptional regulator [Lachnospiraceae bacterium]